MAPEPTPGVPQRVGRYEILTHLATGGMAQIYLARQSGLGSFERHVVLKTILRERASDQRFVTMFLDEAKLSATLNHQNIAQVYEVDQADGAYFMAMEYVHGENARAILETTLRRGWTIPLELAVMIVSGAAAGLHHAHERRGKNGAPLNIVHRDVSPANVMVGYDGSVKVLDFGIAKAEERATKTVGGTIKGKYGYMSPEQCKGKSIDRRSDIFALGICLYELTTLRRAFKGNDDFETMKRIVSGDIMLPSVVVPGYPRELEAIVLTAIANDANARFQTGQEMIEALDAFAVRAKLTGSNTAMGRFMVQLFGSKREPWVEGGNGERTEITEPGNDPDADNEKTHLIEERHQLPPNRAPTATHPGVGQHYNSTPPPAPAQAEWQADSRARQSAPRIGAQSNNYPQQPAPDPTRSTGPAQALPQRLGSPQLRQESNPGYGGEPQWNHQQQQQPQQPQQSQMPPIQHRLIEGVAGQVARPMQPSMRRSWIILAVLMLAGLTAGLLIALLNG
jgi:serine/threonine-protein kinase